MKRKLTWSHFCGPNTKTLNLFLGLGEAKVSYFIFTREKILNYLLTRFRDLLYFFFLESTKFRLIRFEPVNLGELPSNWPKKWSYMLHFQKNTNLVHVTAFFANKMVIEDLLYTICIFFSRGSWEREKKYRYFHSLTPFLKFPS